ncbi:hypothetical protein ACHAXT_008138 [Thalassiosira profunda]
MKSTLSRESSGDDDEFYDAVEHLDSAESNCNGASQKEELQRLESLGEEALEEPTRVGQELVAEDSWASARSFPSQTRSASLMDRVLSEESFSYEKEEDGVQNEDEAGENDNASDTEVEASAVAKADVAGAPDNVENGVEVDASVEMMTDANGESDANRDVPTAPSTPKVPPINMDAISPEHDNLFSVSTREMEDVIEKKYDDEEVETLNRLVDKLQAAEDARPPGEEEEKMGPEEGGVADAGIAEADAEVVVEGSSPDSDMFTPQKIDCNTFVTELVKCDVTSPLEALYLMCPQNYSFRGGQKGASSKQKDGDPPLRTSVSSVHDPEGGAPPPPPSDLEDTDSVQRRLDMDSDDTSSDDSSTSSAAKYQMIDKDTGQVYDVSWSFSAKRNSPSRVDSKESEETESHGMASASFDTDITDGASPKTKERKKGGVKFSSKLSHSKMAANVRKGVAGLKTSRQQKRNRKRTTSADMVPSNAIHVRTSRQKKDKSASSATQSEHSQEIAADSSFNPMLLVKEIPNSHKGPAWCAAFSQNGRFLATGGEDGNVCIWAVSPKSKSLHPNGIATEREEGGAEDEGEANEEDQTAAAPPLHFIGTGPELATNLEILSSEPMQRFTDHTADVIDLSWSHTNFLLSASLDSSVRLYHFSKPGCLHLFKHANLVASVAFHPTDDRYFISGGIDKKLRLWDITSGRVKEWAQAPDVITACRFTPDGKYAVSGLFHGQVLFYDFNGLKYYTQIACRNRSGKHKKGRKVTGISFARGERDDWVQSNQEAAREEDLTSSERATLTERISDTGKGMARKAMSAFRHGAARPEALRYTERMLVSTNDSRVRLYGLSDFQMVRKYKGHTNTSMQIRARISESGSHIASGSESGHVFIWETLAKNRPKKSGIHHTHDKTKSSHHFEASKAPLPIVTDSVFFPGKSVDEALLSSDKVFPFSLGIDRVDDDVSNAAILTLDYDGCLRVFLRKSCIDNILEAATPRGGEIA